MQLCRMRPRGGLFCSVAAAPCCCGATAPESKIHLQVKFVLKEKKSPDVEKIEAQEGGHYKLGQLKLPRLKAQMDLGW